MNWHEFVFSEKASHRFARHTAFWLVWWLYFLGAKYILPHLGHTPNEAVYLRWNSTDLVQSLLLLVVQMLACYAFIYFLLPRYLLKARYTLLLAGTILLGFALIQACYFISTTVIPFIKTVLLQADPTPKPTYWSSVSAGGIGAIKVFAVAAALKLGKRWWLKQKEKERLEKEKIEAELQLLKAQIHPSFLFNTLNNIYSFTLVASPKAPEMLLRLSDILSYMLYECNDPKVPLDKEIKMIRDYMALEKIRYGDRLDMSIRVDGDTSRARITPLLLLRFIENSFKQSSSQLTEQPWINLEIQLEDHILGMKLMNGKPIDTPVVEDEENEDDLGQAKRWLELLYPGHHQLTIAEEPEIMLVNLKVALAGTEQLPTARNAWTMTHALP